MTINALTAANAYRTQLKMQQGMTDAMGEEDETQKPSFSKMLNSAVQDAIGTQYEAESLKMQSLTGGKVELSDLVTAVSNAELTLTTVVAIRDKVITAYQDIIRMPI
jgi:flagellar hook-basal body complex protein FliE